MTFQRTTPTTHYRELRLLSAEGRWELGMCAYTSGMRLRMGLPGRPPSVLDFCMGTAPELFTPVFLAVIQALEPLAETATAEEIDHVFPWAGTRPDLAIHLDALLARNRLAA